MIELKDRNYCCGCSACASICAAGAISMVADSMGFKYPVVDESKCTQCGLCLRVCSWNNGYSTSDNFDKSKVFAFRHTSETELLKSQSGGAFWILATDVIARGGVVYGAMVDDNFAAVHSRATTIDECQKFRGSKYTQSNIDGIFAQVKADLLQGLLVLFTGTPCQVSALKKFIPTKLHNNLILCDLICHGVPSPKVWSEYLKYVENQYNQKIVKVDFRDKSLGWNSHSESFIFADGAKITRDNFRFLFYDELISRPSCSTCRYTNLKRVSDITIADFWGVENFHSDFAADNKGCSLVLVNNEKGMQIFDSLKDNSKKLESVIENCLVRQPQLQHPAARSKNADKFERDFVEHGFEYVLHRYGNEGVRYNRKMLLRKIIKFPGNTYRKMKRLIKK